jgi:lycopene cyclase domain-containing protein
VFPAKYTYLLLMLGSLAYPLFQSFEHRVKMYTRWRDILPAILITAAVFTVWDVYFTLEGVWSFSATHTLSPRLAGMPLEEWSFFLVIPYCCFFVYFVVNYYLKAGILELHQFHIARALGIFLIAFGLAYFTRVYTSVACLGSGSLLVFLSYRKELNFLGRFFLGYLFCLIPFILVNGQLTYIPVVMYNDAENTGIRIFIEGICNIPIEDLAYNLLMLLMNVAIYEYRVYRRGKSKFLDGDALNEKLV